MSFTENMSWGVTLLWELPPCHKGKPWVVELVSLTSNAPHPNRWLVWVRVGPTWPSSSPSDPLSQELGILNCKMGHFRCGRWITSKATPREKSYPSCKFHFFVLKSTNVISVKDALILGTNDNQEEIGRLKIDYIDEVPWKLQLENY